MARPLQKLKNHLIYFAARSLIFLLGLLPMGLVLVLGRVFGALVFTLAGGERRKTLSNILMANPSPAGEEGPRRFARRVWVRLGQNLFETVRWIKWPNERIVARVQRTQGEKNLEGALSRGKGAFVVTAHLGNWELLGGFLGSKYPLSAVAQKVYDPRFDRMVTHFRENQMKMQILKRGMALRGILKALEQNRLVMAACDQDSGREGVFVPFFGKAAWTQSGVAQIALKKGAALVPAFMVRGEDGSFELRVEPEIKLPRTGDFEKDVRETVRRYTEVIETYVKAYPDQWVWMHERWRTRPPDEKI